MNTDILFISPEFIKKKSNIFSNVEDKLLESHIFEAMDMHVQMLTGNLLYNDIISQLQNYKNAVATGFTGSVTTYLSTDYKTLLDEYIQPVTLYYAMYEAGYDVHYKVTNKGVTTQQSENSNPVEDDVIEKLRDNWKNKAEFYAQRTMKFLIDNQNTYTKYRDYYDSSNPEQTIEPSISSYTNGLYLKKTRACRYSPEGNSRYRYK